MAPREKRGYAALVPRTPPEGLWEHACQIGRHSDDDGDLDTYGLVYKKVWVPDETPAGIMGDRMGKKLPKVLCRCSACGQESLMEYVASHTLPDGATYGFSAENANSCSDVAMSGDGFLCPVCDSPVKVKCRSRIYGDPYASNAYITSETGCMSAMLLPGEPGKRPLALICWTVRRYCNKLARDIHVILPSEAYVFDADGCTKLMGWHKAYSGTAGYFTSWYREWHEQPMGWHESWGENNHIFGLTEELLDNSCLHNSALREYMTGGLIGTSKFPVAYLRLYQTHGNVENLARSAACNILNELIREQMPNYKWANNCTGVPEISEICWNEARPSKMLGLDKQEFDMLTRRMASAELWQLFTACRRTGNRMTEDDVELAFRFGDSNLIKLAGQAPMGRICRYLLQQIERFCITKDELLEEAYVAEVDEFGEDAVPDFIDYADMYDDDTPEITASLLSDYWRMADTAGWDLNRPEVRWPKDLQSAHDRADAASKAAVAKESKHLFHKSFMALSVFSFAADGIIIRPCRTQNELTMEGEKLHHCVGGYARDVALGTASIFFIRREKKPKTPWYTLQFDPDRLKVVQNRGLRNCNPTKEVNAFVELWLCWCRDGCQRDKDGSPIISKTKERKSA